MGGWGKAWIVLERGGKDLRAINKVTGQIVRIEACKIVVANKIIHKILLFSTRSRETVQILHLRSRKIEIQRVISLEEGLEEFKVATFERP